MRFKEIIPGLKAPATVPASLSKKAVSAVQRFWHGERNYKRLNENRTGYYKIDLGPFWRLLSRDEGRTWEIMNHERYNTAMRN
ncbi:MULTISPECIES: hypothetical protein [Enterobacterales]|uniref:ParE-like toxin domain-containing protein n=1 Tax=Mixta theicola TaxID=1458355 RepID=A0A2K1Q531_9GAMM|nr:MULTISPECIES: hypothetical protein [Enterobacterales]HBQ2314447.1 hypothetical protein [Klebsiella variicola]HDK6273478.1 hypothetical protein [Klebsiella quasipneumoniae]HDS5277120.1 hypothetical protein [Enterobacter hormaechei subsp. steigerwaltii]HDS9535928.1 hypothetical protein [Klebsiella pneumoniae subsp. pneumoniae]EIV3863097.1 hypothetical protein [Klebsiella pneumoniae]